MAVLTCAFSPPVEGSAPAGRENPPMLAADALRRLRRAVFANKSDNVLCVIILESN